MPKVFIVRPFGSSRMVLKEEGDSYVKVSFNFDRVETDLIRPAMRQLKLSGGTTGEVFAAGSIREDMFSSLLLEDLVLADITIHNANVFYELGIRHALRKEKTILLKCKGYAETPFDIMDSRYITYEKDNPAAALPDLINALNETLGASRTDSPVFSILPQLAAQDPEKYLAMPEDFITEVKVAEGAGAPGKLCTLALEAETFSWS